MKTALILYLIKMDNESNFGGFPAVLGFLLVSYILMWIFC